MGLFPSLQQIKSDRFLLSWNIGSFLTLLLPIIIFSVARHSAYISQGQYQNEDWNNGDGNNYNQQQQTHWWHFWGDADNQNEEARANDQMNAPWWCECERRIRRGWAS